MKRSEMYAKIRKAVLKTITVEKERLNLNLDEVTETILQVVETDMLPPLVHIETHPDEMIFSWEKE